MAAADFLKMFYHKPSTSRDFPAGCYFKGGYGYFNEITDPSQTNPYNFYGIGGLCMEIGKRGHYFKYPSEPLKFWDLPLNDIQCCM